jgi:hypothetical protein
VTGWEKLKKKQRSIELDTIEEALEHLHTLSLSGRATVDTNNNIKELEGRRLKYLLDEEETWRQKSRVIWLRKGDRNTKFFHRYASHRKNQNTIWEMKDGRGINRT